jgi:chromosome segregation ATPase
MLSTGKYFIYSDAARGTKAANVMVKMTPDGDFGFFRITGTDAQIQQGITTLRGRVSISGIRGLIADLKREESDTRARMTAASARIQQLESMLDEGEFQGGQAAVARQTIAAAQNELKDAGDDLNDVRTRITAAEQALQQEAARAGQPAIAQ